MTTAIARSDRTLGELAVGIFLGPGAWIAIGAAGLLVLRAAWPECC